MSNKAVHYTTLPGTLNAPAAHTATLTGTAFDRELGFSNDQGAPYEALDIILDVGAWTDGTHTPKIQDSPDNSVWTDVAAANQLGAFTAISGSGQQNKLQRVSYVGTQRYVRAVVTVSGATTGAIYGVLAVAAYPRNLPTVASGS